MAGKREESKKYLADHRIPQLFEALISSLMLERPDDPVMFIEDKLIKIREIGVDNVNWETFVRDLHPYRDPVRRRLIRDGSKFDKEYEMEEHINNMNENHPQEGNYKPEVFALTEPQV